MWCKKLCHSHFICCLDLVSERGQSRQTHVGVTVWGVWSLEALWRKHSKAQKPKRMYMLLIYFLSIQDYLILPLSLRVLAQHPTLKSIFSPFLHNQNDFLESGNIGNCQRVFVFVHLIRIFAPSTDSAVGSFWLINPHNCGLSESLQPDRKKPYIVQQLLFFFLQISRKSFFIFSKYLFILSTSSEHNQSQV